jgi:hypothetical protein
MGRHKIARAEQRRAEKEARELLQSSRFFNEFLLAVKKAGLVGEELNALVLLIVAVSRVFRRPLNLFVKGHSSSGKNWLVTRLLRLMPKSAVAEITSASDKAWHYSQSDFRHRVVYLQERNEAAGTIDPIRTLISEGKLIRIVPGYENGKRVTKRYVARGPVAAISTTTKNHLQIDDETRHVSCWCNESSEQTRDIVKSYTKKHEALSRREQRTWHMVHRLLNKRVGTRIIFPEWFEEIADRLFVDDLRVRRYYPAFVEACRSVCLIRSFQPHRKRSKDGRLEVDFADFAITALIFDPVFVESLHLDKAAGEAIRRLVNDISARKKRPVDAKDIARKLGISMDKAYAKLRYAAHIGVIRQVNKPQKSNRKGYLSTPRPRFVPDPEKLFRELKDLQGPVRFVHPITGEWVTYRREE